MNILDDLNKLKCIALYNTENQFRIEDLSEEEKNEYRVSIRRTETFIEEISKREDLSWELQEYMSKSVEINELLDLFDYRYQNNYDYSNTNESHISNVIYITEIFNEIIKYVERKGVSVQITINTEYRTDSTKIISYTLEKEFERMEKFYSENNFKEVNALSKSVLETLFKQILIDSGHEDNKDLRKMNFGSLKKNALSKLKIDQKLYSGDTTKFIGNLNKALDSIIEMRNLYSVAHGNSINSIQKYENLPPHYSRLIIDSTKTVFNFIVGSYDYKSQKE